MKTFPTVPVSAPISNTVYVLDGLYLNGLPEPLYMLFGTGYLGYTAARQWGKAKGVER